MSPIPKLSKKRECLESYILFIRRINLAITQEYSQISIYYLNLFSMKSSYQTQVIITTIQSWELRFKMLSEDLTQIFLMKTFEIFLVTREMHITANRSVSCILQNIALIMIKVMSLVCIRCSRKELERNIDLNSNC